MASKKVDLILDQDEIFIKSLTPLDFTKYMGQYALEIEYTNGDTQVLTTESTNPNHFGTYEFDSYQELKDFYIKYRK